MTSVKKLNLTEEKADLLIVGVYAFQKACSGTLAALDVATEGFFSTLVKEDRFTGKKGETLFVRPLGRLKAVRVLLVGLGEQKTCDEEGMRVAASIAADFVRSSKAKRVVMAFAEGLPEAISLKALGKAVVEGIELTLYTFGRYKKTEAAHLETLTLAAPDAKSVRALQEGATLGDIYARATMVTRDLVNTPAYHMSPIELVNAAKSLVKRGSGLSIKVYGRAALEKMGAGGILGIAQGSELEPYLVHMTYEPKRKTKKSVAIVGKAITFDSGGLSLKPADSMMTMKCDMSGAAAVIGMFSVLSELNVPVRVHGIFGACENMPSGRAIRPGDIVKTLNGKTIEVLNTDAEGRVTLADTLAFAAKKKPDAIIDLATLTGACIVALGDEITGLMTNNAALAEKVKAAAGRACEKMWELPMDPSYRTLITSEVADYKNIAGRAGGAITAGLLLEEFVDGTPWVHLDIAGPAFAEKPLAAYAKKGATGHPVRTLLEYVRAL